MIFDSERQKQQILKIVSNALPEVPPTLGEIASGPADDLLNLFSALKNGQVVDPRFVTAALDNWYSQDSKVEDGSADTPPTS